MRHEWKNAIFLRRQKTATESQRKFSPAFFKRRRIPKAEPLGASRRTRNTYLFNKDQEGSPNSPVDCWGVGNPIKGFPDGPHRGPFLCSAFFILLSRLILTQQNCETYSFALLPRGRPLFRAWKSGQKTQRRGCFDSPPPYTSPATTKGSSPFGILRLPTHCVALGFFKSFLFCIRLLFIQCFSKRPRRANESFRPPFSKGGGAEGQSPPRPPQDAKHLFVQ